MLIQYVCVTKTPVPRAMRPRGLSVGLVSWLESQWQCGELAQSGPATHGILSTLKQTQDAVRELCQGRVSRAHSVQKQVVGGLRGV